MHSQISGTVDFREPDDESCLARIRLLVDKMGNRQLGVFDRKKPEEPRFAAEEIYGIFDGDPARQYDMKEIIARIVDGSQFGEYKAEYGETVLCGYARIGGFAVGIVANQKTHVQQIDHCWQQAHRVWRRHLHRVGGEGGALHYGLQPEPGAPALPARCEWLHGGTRRRVERHHQAPERRW